MQKRYLLYLSIVAAVIFCFSYAQAAIQFLPRYQGSYGTRNQEGGRDKVEVTCKTYGGVEKSTNQTCTGQFTRAGLTCYKSCSCNKTTFQYTIAAHQGDGKLCASLSNACTDSAGTSYSTCSLNTCNVRNSTWISESSKESYTSNNYECTSQNATGKDGACYLCACPSDWATGSCPDNADKCSTCKAIDPYTVSKFNLESCKAGYYKDDNSCTKCPAGSYCDGINKTLCPAGSYSAAGASSCTSCVAGTYSAEKGATACTECEAGTYSTAGSSKCLDCSAGTYSGKAASKCDSCPAGKYSSAKASFCNICSAGTYSSAGASSCTECEAGTYSGREASKCLDCSAGTYSGKKASTCSACTGNTYSAAKAGSCTSCSSGMVANSTHTGCEVVPCAKYLVAPWVQAETTSEFETKCESYNVGSKRYYGYGAQFYSSSAKEVCEEKTYIKCVDCFEYIGEGATRDKCETGYVKVKADGTISRGYGQETIGCGFCSNDCDKAFSGAVFVTGDRSNLDGFADSCLAEGMGYVASEFYDCGGKTYAPCQNCTGVTWVTRGMYISSTSDLSDSAWNSQCSSKYGSGTIKDEKVNCGYKRYYSCKCDSGYIQTSTGCEANIGPCSRSSTCSDLSFNNGYTSGLGNVYKPTFGDGRTWKDAADATCRGIYKNGSYANSCVYCEKNKNIYIKCNNSGIQDGFCTSKDCNATP